MREAIRRLWDGQRLKLTWNQTEVITLDGRGRPVAFSWGSRQFRRGLDGGCKEILRVAGETREFYDSRSVPPPQMEEILMNWSERLGNLMQACEAERWILQLRQDALDFRSIYQPISILPPDQYRSLVFQLTEGCSYNRCSFCQLYRDRPYHCKDLSHFREHVLRALSYFGSALPWRRGLFLGDASATGISTHRLVEALQLLRQVFPCSLEDRQGNPRHPLEFDRISSFQDTFSSKERGLKDWQELRRWGLRQIHLGVESGSEAVLKLLGKPSSRKRVRALVQRLQEADIDVSLIFLLGAGGQKMAGYHLQESYDLVKSLNLRPQDRVYLSELLIHPNSEYHLLAQALDIQPLSREECRHQAHLLREALKFPPPPAGPAISLYDVRQFVYV